MLRYSIESFFPAALAVLSEALTAGKDADTALSAATAVMYEDVVKRTAELVVSHVHVLASRCCFCSPRLALQTECVHSGVAV